MVSPFVPAIVTVSLLLGMPGLSTGWSPAPAPSLAELWQPPADVSAQNVVDGAWGPENAPSPSDIYTFVRDKKPSAGSSPGLVVTDSRGRRWHVKQGREASPEVVVSRVLSAVGYHQPPVYFLPSFMMQDASGTRRVPGGRFRLHDGTMHSRGPWLWQRNPFIGTRPFQGLLVILLAFNSFDLKSSNNSVYEVRLPGGRTEQWYVVRDLGAALGESARLGPTRNDPGRFERQTFITGIRDGFVTFSYHGWHPELFRGRIVPADLEWAATLLSGLSDRQWDDAFRAGGFTPAVAGRYLRKLRANIARAQQFSNAPAAGAVERR